MDLRVGQGFAHLLEHRLDAQLFRCALDHHGGPRQRAIGRAVVVVAHPAGLPDAGRAVHVQPHHHGEIAFGQRRVRAGLHEGDNGGDLDRLILGIGAQRLRVGFAQLRRLGRGEAAAGGGRADHDDTGDGAVARHRQVVADHPPAHGPADQQRLVQAQRLDDRGDIAGPWRGVVIGRGFRRLARGAMAAQVRGDQAEFLGQIAAELLGPAQMVLRPAMDQHDRPAVRVAGLVDMQLDAVMAGDPVRDLVRGHSHPSP